MTNKCRKISSKNEYFFLGIGQYGCTVKNSDFNSNFRSEELFSEKVHRKKLIPKKTVLSGELLYFWKNSFLGLSFFGAFFLKYSLRSKIGVHILTPMLTYFDKKMFPLRKDSFSHKNMKSAAQR
jgi:hypothetical protein